MQFDLLSRLGPRVVRSRAEPPSTVPGAWRDSAISQLEALAEANARAVVMARRRRAAGLVSLVGAVLLFGATLWRPAGSDAAVTPGTRVASASVSTRAPAAPAAAPAAVPAATATPAVVAAGPAAPGTESATTPVADAQPVVATPDDEAARQARAARRKAALAQERARAEAEAQRMREQEQAEAARAREQQLALEASRQRAAAEQARLQAALQLARDARRGVRESCAAAGGFFAEQFCHTRECRQPEHAGDAVCVRLRELDLARLREGADH